MTAMGHEEQFPPPSLSGRCRLGEATFAETCGNGEVAPKPAVPGTVGLPKKSNLRQSFGYVQAVSDRASYRRRETTA
jgi:hypothetical protein